MSCPPGLETQDARWLVENGPQQLELLLRALIYPPSEPTLIADNDRHHRPRGNPRSAGKEEDRAPTGREGVGYTTDRAPCTNNILR